MKMNKLSTVALAAALLALPMQSAFALTDDNPYVRDVGQSPSLWNSDLSVLKEKDKDDDYGYSSDGDYDGGTYESKVIDLADLPEGHSLVWPEEAKIEEVRAQIDSEGDLCYELDLTSEKSPAELMAFFEKQYNESDWIPLFENIVADNQLPEYFDIACTNREDSSFVMIFVEMLSEGGSSIEMVYYPY